MKPFDQFHRKLLFLLISSIFVFTSLWLTACAAPPKVVAANKLEKPTTTQTTDPATATVQPTFTPTPYPTKQSEPPVTLSFPSPAAEPVFDWRPPLYEIPLALNPNDHFYFSRPIAVDSVNWPLPDYRYGYIYPELGNMHTGTDIVAPLHTPVLAAAGGKVVFAGYGLLNGAGDKEDPYGLAVVIRHEFSFQNRTVLSVYAHLEKTAVKVGDYVELGDQIGNVGMTGATSGPHLHFEIRLEDGEFIIQNPELWVVPPVGYGVLAGRIMNTYGSLLGECKVWVKSIESGETWTMYTYSTRMIQVDPYYKENFVLSDLPAGDYEVSFYYYGRKQTQQITVHPGAVTYFRFNGSLGFSIGDPPAPRSEQFVIPIQ